MGEIVSEDSKTAEVFYNYFKNIFKDLNIPEINSVKKTVNANIWIVSTKLLSITMNSLVLSKYKIMFLIIQGILLTPERKLKLKLKN